MRKLYAGVALAFLAACGGSDGPTTPVAPTTGTAKYVRDANTCTGNALAFEFFLDGAQLGGQTLSPGQSASFTVAAGGHVFSAKVSNTVATFAAVNGTVQAGGTFTYTMVC